MQCRHNAGRILLPAFFFSLSSFLDMNPLRRNCLETTGRVILHRKGE